MPGSCKCFRGWYSVEKPGNFQAKKHARISNSNLSHSILYRLEWEGKKESNTVVVGPIILFPKFIDVTQESASSEQSYVCNGDYKASASEIQRLSLNLLTNSSHVQHVSGWRFWREAS